ncbi:MAG: hypothetical protein U0289_02800 [Cyclobacteriaceae bacterium]|jgi:hypothetical protein|nr:hypothetical protein [Cytophagales bacterium]HNP77079.1 hypothetical protein [Cyclobacteriaceae bacterium]HQQ82068.1 hypothetical protein [Cyclobacteriaceae bacterium]
MDEKISFKALDDYSDDYASKVVASFFSTKDKITGPEILKLCDIHQINLFVLSELLHAWKLESQRLRSPFFDYTAPEVAEALAKFLNLLSNHIAISRESFQPLLKKAVRQTLYLLLDPYDFYADKLDNGAGGAVRAEELKADIKYIKINRIPLERLLATMEEKKMTSISGNEAFALLDRILEEVNFTPEDLENYISAFSTVVPVDMHAFYESKSEPVNKPVEVAVQKPEPIKTPTPVVKAPEPQKPEPPKPAVVQTTLYDQLQKGPQTTVADNFQIKKKIKESLTINQKFMFTKILFNGDFELFSAAVERLDELDNLAQAKTYLQNNYGEWDVAGEEYQEFMEILERRFAS